MAWRSSGTTNTELVDNLVENGLITNSEIERGFRRVDRKYFVPKGCEDEAYSDSPIRSGGVHISAPHIYCTVLEALDLTPKSSTSFLNIGSGSGYLTCIASEILGPKSLFYGVDINKEALVHCQEAVANWHMASSTSPTSTSTSLSSTSKSTSTLPLMHFIHGNGLNIQPDAGESIHGFDRIYAGAAISFSQQKKIQQLLSPGGVMVAPVGDELRKIIRSTTTFLSPSATSSSSSTKADVDVEIDPDEFTTQTISGVHFASLLSMPPKKTILPCAQWSTANHHLYPNSFQKAITTLLLCRNSKALQEPPKPDPVVVLEKDCINVSAFLPKEVWLHILSYTTRKWFEPKKSEVELLREETKMLRQRLSNDQRKLSHCQQALSHAESRNRVRQRQNQIHLSIARHLHHHIESMLIFHQESTMADGHGHRDDGHGDHGDDDNYGREREQGLSLTAEMLSSTESLIRQSRNTLFNSQLNRMDADASFEMMMEEDDDDDSESENDEDYEDESVNNEEDNEESSVEEEFDDDEEMSSGSESHFSVDESQSDNIAMVDDDNNSSQIQQQNQHQQLQLQSQPQSSAGNVRQVRTVSISSLDL